MGKLTSSYTPQLIAWRAAGDGVSTSLALTPVKSISRIKHTRNPSAVLEIIHNITTMATAKIVAPGPITEVPIPIANKAETDIKTEEIAEKEPLPFDPVALKEKYLAERDRRLARNEGVEQYTLLDGKLSHYLKDPWVEPGFTRDPVEEETRVVIVGGGYGAQVVAVKLIEAGVRSFRIIEKAGDFGGTW